MALGEGGRSVGEGERKEGCIGRKMSGGEEKEVEATGGGEG